jgi:hypothetical protein
MEILIIIFIVYLIILGSEGKDLENKDLNNYHHELENKEEEFYHPITGYKGTKSEMDTYIVNRERKINEKN